MHKKPVKEPRPLKKVEFGVVRRGFAAGITKVEVPVAHVPADKAGRKTVIQKWNKSLNKMNFETANPRTLLSVALYALSIPELSNLNFGPSKKPALLSGVPKGGMSTGPKQNLIDIVGRFHKRQIEKTTPLLTEGEIKSLRKNLPNLRQRISQLVQSKEFSSY